MLTLSGWLVIQKGRRLSRIKKLAGKFKDCVYELSSMSSYTTKSISELKTMVVAAKKAEDQAISNTRSLKK